MDLVRRALSTCFAAVAAASSLTSCRDASGCSSFDPSSTTREIGDVFEATIEVGQAEAGQGWFGTLDAAGYYWAYADGEPVSLEPGDYDVVVTYVQPDTVLVDVGDGRTFTFVGPVSCE